ncbi:hypothetical protein B0H99_102301 [Planomicrobium soli]|uniref:Uncharacterized protein n=1 Tax=Planomicrobium soli TaxID=1176648 RepID=A0A2P8H5W2_9BACL|nr:hypothetical protein [Planomicrobium soli]PSL41617.1 hypothetical protein B0H99_102301 [Planomicrobium soli]
MNEPYEFKVAWCKICDQGWLTIVKNTVTAKYWVMCEECESEWSHPLHAQLNINVKEHNEHSVRTPTKEEILESGWADYNVKV